MRNTFLHSLISLSLFLIPGIHSSQVPDLGVASTFALFTAVGAFNGDLGTTVIGDIGTNVGAFTPPGIHIGEVHVADPVSAQAATDVLDAYAFLDGLTCGTVLGTTLGNNQVLGPGIYCTGAATTINGTLTLDGQGDPDAIFIFQIDGALSTGTLSNIMLINGANLCNVYFQVNGAVELGVNSVFQGTILANGAISLLSGATLYGRGLSTAGAISTNANLVQLPVSCICALTITCPPVAGGTFDCAADVPAPDENLITIIDSCGTVTITTSDVTTGTGCGIDTMFVTREYFITDGTNLDTCTQVFKAIDNDIPVLMNCPASITVSCEDQVPEPSITGITATDNCDVSVIITFVSDVVSNQTCANRYMLTRIYSATDDCANSATCTQMITVIDTTSPIFTFVPPNTTVACDATPVFGTPAASDNCGSTVSFTSMTSSVLTANCAGGTTTRTWTATDNCGNTATASQTLTLVDTTPPVFTFVPASTTISCDAPPVFGTPTATDNCDLSVAITPETTTDPTANCAGGTTTRTWTATDNCGNTATASQTLTLVDTAPPVFTFVPADATVQCGTTPVFGTPTATDNCDLSVAITFITTSNPTANCAGGTTTRIWTATDNCGNTSTADQILTFVDTQAPMITCPTVVTSIECPAVPIFPPAMATDVCDQTPTVTSADVTVVSPVCSQEYTVTRTWTATDDCGNSSTCSRTITVTDNTPPTLTCPTVVTSIECPAVPSFPPATATDLCDPTPTVTSTDVTIPSGICPQEYSVTRTWTATDDCGNSSTCSRTITVTDNTPPSITCPPNAPVQCASQVPPVNTQLVVASDLCGGPITVTFVADVIIPMGCVNRFTVIRTYSATDQCGNTSTCNQTITVNDNTAPIITCPANVTVQCASQVPPVNMPGATASDNCAGAFMVTFVGDVITLMGPQGCLNRFTVTRTYRATDVCGNSATCAQVITVFDDTPPAITCPANVTIQCASQVPPVNIASVITSDNCGGTITVTNVSNVITNQTCVNRFILTRTYRATDACGNSASCVQVITVFDNTPPSINLTDLGVPNGGTIEVQCFGQDPEWELPSFDEGSVDVTDNCAGTVTVTFNEILFDEGNCEVDGYINLYRLTWTAIDACGNSSSAFVFLALIDTIPPVIVGVPQDITVNCDEIPLPPAQVYATDECLCACVVLFQETIPISGCQDGQVITRSWTARDHCGNETIEIQNITLIDDQGPELQIIQPEIANMPDGTILEYTCNEGGFPSFFDLLNEESVFSPVTCGTASIISFERDVVIANNCEFFGFVEQRTFRWEGVDQCGNETSLTVVARLIDNEAPVLIGVPDTACVGDPSLANVDASDNCGSPSIRFWDVSILNPCGTGMAIRRTYEAFDDCGNIATDTSILIPNDQTLSIVFINPVLEDLEDGEILVVDCFSNGGNYTSFGTGDVSVVDLCPGGTTIVFSEIIIDDGDDLPGGIIAIIELHWLATDVCGNSSELIVTTHIITQPGGTGPVFVNFNPGISIGCNDELPEIFVTDNGGGEISITVLDSIIYGDCPFEYDILRVVTATDVCGRTTTKMQNIHVGGNGPVIEGLELEICDDLTIPEVTAYDECAEEFVEVNMVEDTLDIPCRDGLVIQRTWTAIDTCGNVTEIIQTIIMNDQTPPEILIPSYSVIRRFMDNSSNLIFFSQIDLVDRLNALNENSLFVTDECDLEIIPVFTVDTIIGDCVADGFFQRRIYTWVATDVCGNSTSVSFSVDMMDDIPPVISGLPNDTTIICVPLGLPPVIQAQDLAQPVTIVYTESIEAGEAPGTFIVIRRWVATDDCGNTSEAIQRIIWIPDTFLECEIIVPPLVECNSHGVVIGSLLSGGLGSISYDWEIVGEKCFIQGGQGTPELIIYVGFSDVKIILTVTDEFGCVSMCMITINCLDASAIPLSYLPGQAAIKSAPQHIDAVNTELPENLSQLAIWPNPVSSTINLSFESMVEKEMTVSFMNILGQAVLSNEIIAKKGFNSYKVDVSVLPEGSYILRLKTENEVHSRVIIRQ